MRKRVSLFSIVLAIAFLGGNAFITRSDGQKGNEDLLRLPVKNLRMQGKSLHLVLSSISDQNNLPIGFEVSLADDVAISKTITIDIKDGTLEEVLNSIVNQYPIYSWEIRDHVINIFPREAHRDPVLKEVLETKLDKVSIDKETTRFTLRETLCKNDAVMKILNLNDVISANESLGSRDFGKLGHDFSFEASNVSIATILNRVIRESQTKYWILMRHGERRQYLVLNL
jgi:hypothetical protein